MMRTFKLRRNEDVTGVSGTGVVAEGVQLSNGKCVLSWLTQYTSVAIYEDIETLIKIHEHGGRTVVEWDVDLAAENAALRRTIDGFYDAVAHGEEGHRAWLRDTIDAYLAALPPPPQDDVVVPAEAYMKWQWLTFASYVNAPLWVKESLVASTYEPRGEGEDQTYELVRLTVRTLDGDVEAVPGDWFVRDGRGVYVMRLSAKATA